jgi:metal-dependent HD superfamily phosphatase/phosphodiesterase
MKKQDKITLPTEQNKLLEQALEVINTNEEVKTLWKVINVNAIDRLNMNDHGIVHFQIVSNIGLKLLRMLKAGGIKPSVCKDYKLSHDYAELVVVLGCLFHDVGMTISRPHHEEYSLFLTNSLLREILTFLPVEERTIIISETLHTIISHRKDGKPITYEAGIVRVADALDMTFGRSRIVYELGSMSIHALSAAAVKEVIITKGDERPIQVIIKLYNTMGMFQIEELMEEKIKGSKIEKFIEVVASLEGENEKTLMKEVKIAF